MKRLHIFRAGRHQDISGQTLSFSEADLAATAAAYNPALHEAPIVIGHPSLDAPAYGWIKSLTASADGITAIPHQVNPAFAEEVKQGMRKKISASFYSPDAPNNPVKGVYYLRHVGVLGAMPPAIKGLKAISFSEHEEGIVEFSESDLAEGQQLDAGLWRNLRDWLIEHHGIEEADKVVPTWQLDALNARARDAADEAPDNDAAIEAVKDEQTEDPGEDEPAHAFAEGSAGYKLAQQNAALKAQLAKVQQQQKAVQKHATHAANVAFAESLVAKGMKPVHVDTVVNALDAASSGAVAFSEDNNTLADSLRQTFTALAGNVSFAEKATHARAAHIETNPLLADAEARGKKS